MELRTKRSYPGDFRDGKLMKSFESRSRYSNVKIDGTGLIQKMENSRFKVFIMWSSHNSKMNEPPLLRI